MALVNWYAPPYIEPLHQRGSKNFNSHVTRGSINWSITNCHWHYHLAQALQYCRPNAWVPEIDSDSTCSSCHEYTMNRAYYSTRKTLALRNTVTSAGYCRAIMYRVILDRNIYHALITAVVWWMMIEPDWKTCRKRTWCDSCTNQWECRCKQTRWLRRPKQYKMCPEKHCSCIFFLPKSERLVH